jgi:deoxyadenosine/deoxycytidine kinase
MDSYLISIAGNIAAGKSTLTKALENYRQYLSFFDDL